jgi:hypothetical protein
MADIEMLFLKKKLQSMAKVGKDFTLFWNALQKVK